MIIDEGNNDLVFVTDYRGKIDVEMESVLRAYPLRPYVGHTRIALFDYKERPDARLRAHEKRTLRAHLERVKARVTVVIPTVALDEDDRAETICWGAFGAPEGIAAMRSAFFEWAPDQYVVPIFGLSPFLKELQRWQNDETIKRAQRIAAGEELLKCRVKRTKPCEYSIARMLRAPYLAIDIESIEGADLITAVGISDGLEGVSVPVDAYQPYGRTEKESGASEGQLRELTELLASDLPKIFHNYTFDVPRLEARGLHVGGKVHDTFCAMAIAYPELSHGLQSSCAALLAIPPWKSMWHPRIPGITREDIEYWICDPEGLRDYNADDAFYTWHLGRVVLPCVGIDLWEIDGRA